MNIATDQINDVLTRARAEVSKVIIGQDDVVDKALIAIFTGHHALIEGVPGVAKTLLVRTLARVLGCEFNRIQFTPDLMPADITGTSVFNLQRNEFTLIKGPVFTTFLLADEINRAPAKTQSALLQAMQERRVTIDRETHRALAKLHRLRHAESHRVRRHLSAARSAERPLHAEDLDDHPRPRKANWNSPAACSAPTPPKRPSPPARCNPSSPPTTSRRLRRALEAVTVREELIAYVVDVVRATRKNESVLVGAGPRATQCAAARQPRQCRAARAAIS